VFLQKIAIKIIAREPYDNNKSLHDQPRPVYSSFMLKYNFPSSQLLKLHLIKPLVLSTEISFTELEFFYISWAIALPCQNPPSTWHCIYHQDMFRASRQNSMHTTIHLHWQPLWHKLKRNSHNLKFTRLTQFIILMHPDKY